MHEEIGSLCRMQDFAEVLCVYGVILVMLLITYFEDELVVIGAVIVIAMAILEVRKQVAKTAFLALGGYSQTSKAYIVLNKETMRIEDPLNVTFDESLPEPKSSPSVEYDRINELIVQDLNGSPSLQINVSDEGYPKSVKEVIGSPIEQVIGELNERSLRSKTKQA
ncbi:hypothetical protein Tco_0915932 [Tanacetum coccineum]